MSAFYLGDLPKVNQTVPASLSDKAINLVPTPPGKLPVIVTNTNYQPNHDIFVRNLPAFVRAAATGVHVQISRKWLPLERAFLPDCAKIPQVCWSYPSRVSSDYVNGLRGFIPNLQETVIKGKPALIAPLTTDMVKRVVQDGALQTTPSNLTSININSYRAYLNAYKIIDAILRTNQYACRTSGAARQIPAFDERIHLETDSFVVTSIAADAQEGTNAYQTMIPRSEQYRARSNLLEPYSTFNYVVQGNDDLPTGWHGMLIPFEEDLAAPDYTMVASFFGKYGLGFFGDVEEVALTNYGLFKGGIGGLVGTRWGNHLAHLCWCLDTALCAQSTLRLWMDQDSNYLGSIILGAEFRIKTKDNRDFAPVDAVTLARDITQSTPHTRALDAIINAFFTDPMDIGAAHQTIRSTHDLRAMIYRVGITETRNIIVKDQLRNLSFPGQVPYLSPTHSNIVRVLTKLNDADPTNDTSFPLHPSQVLQDDRVGRLWSSFGPLAPSFLVPGGKGMMLSSNFIVKVKKGKEVEDKTVTKVGIILKSLTQAIQDINTVRETRKIDNPHGTAVMGRVSSDSIIRSFEADAASQVLGALRTYCGISVVNAVEGVLKRKRDGDDEGKGLSKRLHMDDF